MKYRLVGLCSIAILASTAFAQDPASATALAKVPPVITAAAAGESVRFSSAAEICQIRLQVLSADGAPIFDSSWKDGDLFDWMVESQGHPLTSGTYRCLVMVKDLDGRVSQREATLIAQGGKVSFDPSGGNGGLTIVAGNEAPAKITVLAHDGANGSIVSTGGDLSFRFGNFLAGQDSEKMRLTSEGKLGIGTDKPQATLDVAGPIRTSKGVLFPDGTILTSIDGQLTTRQYDPLRDGPGAPVDTSAVRLAQRPAMMPLVRPTPRPLTAGTPRFITTDTGVGIWNATPAYTLDVGGAINTSSFYRIRGDIVLATGLDNTFLGINTGASTIGDANTFLGFRSGYSNTSGSNNVFVGKNAGYGNMGGINNTAVGFIAGTSNTSGTGNSFFGNQTGYGNSTGGLNTFIGAESGASITVESLNTALGFQADLSAGVANATAIGTRAKATQSNTVIIGGVNGVNNATVTSSVGIATQTPNQYLGVGGGMTVDQNNANDGTLLANSVLAFGTATGNAVSGEAIASQRTAGGNQYGLDFYTLYGKRMSITNGGNVGIATSSPTATFEVAAGKTTLADAWTIRSSARFKDNIKPIDSALDKTERLRGVSFDYKDSGAHSLGFIAEEVAEIVPEAVQRNADGEVVGLDYNRITPLLVEAVKAQEKVIRALEERIHKLESAAVAQEPANP